MCGYTRVFEFFVYKSLNKGVFSPCKSVYRLVFFTPVITDVCVILCVHMYMQTYVSFVVHVCFNTCALLLCIHTYAHG
jgi:hypothetical protein